MEGIAHSFGRSSGMAKEFAHGKQRWSGSFEKMGGQGEKIRINRRLANQHGSLA